MRRYKGLKATNERQDDGVGILHQVAQFPLDQVYFIYKASCPSPTTQDPERHKVLAAEQVGLYASLNPPSLAQRGSWNVWAVNNNQSLSEVLNIWNVIYHATTSPECDLAIVWHPGTQLMLGHKKIRTV